MSNEEKKVVSMEEAKAKTEEVNEGAMSDAELDGFPTRREIIDIMTQMTENINQMGSYLMEDVNTMYGSQVFPFQLRFAVLEEILIEKGFATKEEIDKLVDVRYAELEKQAKEIKEKEQSEEKADELMESEESPVEE